MSNVRRLNSRSQQMETMFRVIALAAVIGLFSVQTNAADEAVWLRCTVSVSSLRASNQAQNMDENLFVVIDDRPDNPSRRLSVRIWSNRRVGSEAYYSWSEGSSPDTVTSSVGKHGWSATRRRSLPDDAAFSSEIAVDRETGLYSEVWRTTRAGLQLSETVRKGTCKRTSRWIDLP